MPTSGEYKTASHMIYLAGCAANTVIPDKNIINEMDLEAVYSLSCSLNIEAMAYMAMNSISDDTIAALDPDLMKKWAEKADLSIYKSIAFDVETKRLTDFLETNGIWYVLLKGIALKDLYPQIGMRQMCDADILYDKTFQEQVYQWFTDKRYEVKSYKKIYEDDYIKPPFYNFEMHTSLFNSYRQTWVDYYSDVRKRLIHDENKSYACHFSDEDFYVYLVAHAYKHYTDGGTGLRFLLDSYVYLTAKNSMDWSYIQKELSKLDILNFESQTRSLSLKMFSQPNLFNIDSLPESDKDFFEGFLFAGTYGSIDFRVKYTLKNSADTNGDNSNKGKVRYVMRRLFPDSQSIKANYPFFDRHPQFLIFAYPYRLIYKAVKCPQKIVDEFKTLLNI